MIDRTLLTELYYSNETYDQIGKRFGVSRQRIWQAVKKLDLQPRIDSRLNSLTSKPAPRPEEKAVAKILRKQGLKVTHMGYNAPYDLLVNGQAVEVKHRKNASKGDNTARNYYSFSNTNNRVHVDFYIFICGKLSSAKFYVYPSRLISRHKNIPEAPKNKTKNLKYENAWYLLKGGSQ